MKKTIIIVLMALLLLTGCSSNLETSQYSDILNDLVKSVDVVTKPSEGFEVFIGVPECSLLGTFYNKNFEIYKVEESSESSNKYICGYVSNKVYKKIIEKYDSNWEIKLHGYGIYIDSLLYYYCTAMTELYHKNYKEKMKRDPIDWYEIEKDKEIPDCINGKKLISVFEDKTVVFTNLFDTQIYKKTILYENYDKISILNKRDICAGIRDNINENNSYLYISNAKIDDIFLKQTKVIYERNYYINLKEKSKKIVQFDEEQFIDLANTPYIYDYNKITYEEYKAQLDEALGKTNTLEEKANVIKEMDNKMNEYKIQLDTLLQCKKVFEDIYVRYYYNIKDIIFLYQEAKEKNNKI